MCKPYRDQWNSDDPTTRAIVRGRSITSQLARLVAENERGAYRFDMREALAGRFADPVLGLDEAATLRHVWATHIDPAGGYRD